MGSSVPLISSGHLDPALFLRSFGKVEFAPFVLEAVWADSSLSSRQVAQAEVSMLVFGKSCSGASLFAMDSSGLGSLMAARSVVYSGSLMSTVGMLRVGGRGLFVEDFAQMDFSLSSRALA